MELESLLNNLVDLWHQLQFLLMLDQDKNLLNLAELLILFQNLTLKVLLEDLNNKLNLMLPALEEI
jgi:hypothetical protein